jgi:hypothetical protein
MGRLNCFQFFIHKKQNEKVLYGPPQKKQNKMRLFETSFYFSLFLTLKKS